MTQAEKETMNDEMQDSRIYEAAFHLLPSLDEAGAAAAAQELRSFIESHGGTVLGGGAPMLMSLAYPLQKDIDRKRHTFTTSYFGWLVFELTPEAAHELKEMLATHTQTIRSLVIKTVKEAAEDRPHPATVATPDEEVTENTSEETPSDDSDSDKEESSEEMDVEQVDEEIEKLVVE